jgi:hypothetical protein
LHARQTLRAASMYRMASSFANTLAFSSAGKRAKAGSLVIGVVTSSFMAASYT